MSLTKRVLSYWFGSYPVPNGPLSTSVIQKWFSGGKEVDSEIEMLFGKDVDTLISVMSTPIDMNNLSRYFKINHKQEEETRNEQTATLESREESIFALIIAYDQFTRNLHRGSPLAFSGDKMALELAKHAIEKKMDKLFPPVPRAFFYMPFMHDESRLSQLVSVRLFQDLVDEFPENEMLKGTLGFAIRHKVIIDRFGRYPHRNKILGRSSTPDESKYMEEGGDSFA